MQSRAWTVLLALAAACATPALAAVPFTPNRTAILLTRPSLNSAARPPGGRRRARDAAFYLTTTPRTSPQPPSQPAMSGPYWANSSLADVEVSCDDAAKPCLDIGRLLHEPSSRCYPIGSPRPCNDTRYSWVVDADALREGRLRGVCRRKDPCVGFTMAYDGVCYNATHIYTKLCNHRASFVLHPTGRWECESSKDLSPAEKNVVQQPAASGRCVIPNFQERDVASFRVACAPHEAQCLRAAKLPFQENCARPLSRKACSPGQWLVLDERAAAAGRLRASCVPERPCGARAQLLRADGRCHGEETLRNVLCPNERLQQFPTGETVCTSGVGYVVDSREEAGMCEIRIRVKT